MNTLILNDGSKLEYTLGGAVSMIGDMYIDIPNITLTKAVIIFSNTEKTKHMEFWSGGSVAVFDGFTELGGVEVPYNLPDTVRITIKLGGSPEFRARKKAGTNATEEQYKAALELLGIETEVNES